jgi:LacI family transcriptional regulator
LAGAKQRVSAQDVAREAGVSRTTVSFVLNNTPGKSITEATRRRVLEAAARLGYMPNQDAQRLARTRDYSIGLFISHSQFVYSDVFVTRALEGMSQAANRFRARLVVHPVSLRESSYLSLARHDNVDGIILINTHDEDPALQELEESGYPAVAMDFIGNARIDQVYVDNGAAAEEMVRHLIRLGHGQIAMISHAAPLFFASRKRVQGYRHALEEAGIPFDPSLVRYGDFSERSGFERMQELLRENPEITGVFAGNDVVAYGALQAILQAGVRVPEEMSLVGFDDDYMSRFLSPALTTMVLPAAGHGSAAVETLMDRITGNGGHEPVRRVLNAHIAVRESTAVPREE